MASWRGPQIRSHRCTLGRRALIIICSHQTSSGMNISSDYQEGRQRGADNVGNLPKTLRSGSSDKTEMRFVRKMQLNAFSKQEVPPPRRHVSVDRRGTKHLNPAGKEGGAYEMILPVVTCCCRHSQTPGSIPSTDWLNWDLESKTLVILGRGKKELGLLGQGE